MTAWGSGSDRAKDFPFARTDLSGGVVERLLHRCPRSGCAVGGLTGLSGAAQSLRAPLWPSVRLAERDGKSIPLALLHLDVRRPDHLAPLLSFLGDGFFEFDGCFRHRCASVAGGAGRRSAAGAIKSSSSQPRTLSGDVSRLRHCCGSSIAPPAHPVCGGAGGQDGHHTPY